MVVYNISVSIGIVSQDWDVLQVKWIDRAYPRDDPLIIFQSISALLGFLNVIFFLQRNYRLIIADKLPLSNKFARGVPDTASYIRGWIQMVLAPNDLFSWNNKYSKYTNIYIHCQCIHFHLLAEHINSLCACWHLEAVKGSSSSSSCRLLISPCITSYPFPCPVSTDALCSHLWGPVPPFPKLASLFTGSAHTPFPWSTTIGMSKLSKNCKMVALIKFNGCQRVFATLLWQIYFGELEGIGDPLANSTYFPESCQCPMLIYQSS